MLSNFPVWLFDVDDRDATRPTFGFRLTGGKGVGGGIQHLVNGFGWPVKLGSEMFHTAMEAWDKRFMSHSTEVRTCPVDGRHDRRDRLRPHEGAAGLAAQLRQDRGGRVPRPTSPSRTTSTPSEGSWPRPPRTCEIVPDAACVWGSRRSESPGNAEWRSFPTPSRSSRPRASPSRSRRARESNRRSRRGLRRRGRDARRRRARRRRGRQGAQAVGGRDRAAARGHRPDRVPPAADGPRRDRARSPRAGVIGFAMESIPRISRAQTMDALSSQANVGGYKAVLARRRPAAEVLPDADDRRRHDRAREGARARRRRRRPAGDRNRAHGSAPSSRASTCARW